MDLNSLVSDVKWENMLLPSTLFYPPPYYHSWSSFTHCLPCVFYSSFLSYTNVKSVHVNLGIRMWRTKKFYFLFLFFWLFSRCNSVYRWMYVQFEWSEYNRWQSVVESVFFIWHTHRLFNLISLQRDKDRPSIWYDIDLQFPTASCQVYSKDRYHIFNHCTKDLPGI